MKDPVSAPEDTNHLEDTLSLVREHISQQDKLHEACNRSLLAWIWKTAVHAFLGRTENVPKMNDILADILKMTMEDIKQAKQEKGQAT